MCDMASIIANDNGLKNLSRRSTLSFVEVLCQNVHKGSRQSHVSTSHVHTSKEIEKEELFKKKDMGDKETMRKKHEVSSPQYESEL